MSHWKQRASAVMMVAAIVMVSGCGDTGQDSGKPANIVTTIEGLGIDGRVVRALVYIDENENAQHDSFEPWAFTDDQGFFSRNTESNVDYCATDSENPEFCLQATTTMSDALLRIEGGYDRLTGEPFYGVLSSRVSVTDNSTVASAVVSPITSLFAEASTAEAQTELLSVLGLSDSAQNIDYFADTDGDGESDVNTELFNIAIKVHKVVTVVADRLEDTYDKIGDESSLPQSVSPLVYQELVENFFTESATINIDQIFESESDIASLVDSVEEEVRALYTEKDLTLPGDIFDGSDTASISRLLTNVVQIPDVVDTVLTPSGSDLTLLEATAGARAIEIVTRKISDETVVPASTSDDVANAITIFSDSTVTYYDDVLTALEADNIDMVTLYDSDFVTNFGNELLIVEETELSSTAIGFSDLVGSQLLLSETPEVDDREDLEDKELEIYFAGAEGATSGTLTACIKFIDGASFDSGVVTLGSGSTRGELITGSWSILNEYSLVLLLNFLGDSFQAIVKPIGEVSGNLTYRSDYNGQLANLIGADGVVLSTNVATTDAECQAALPTRIGLPDA